MSYETQFRDPITYLSSHWSKYNIPPGAKWDRKLDIETNWWNGVTIKSESALMCSRCQQD